MTYLSIIEKFKILFESLFDFKFILVFMILLMLLTFLFGIKKLSTKKYTLFMIISFMIMFSISIISNYKILSNTFDNFTTIFFGNIYFPSIYVYIGVLIISFIAFITSLLNKIMYKIYKIIHTIMFVVNNFLFVIILNIIAKNKIDIFSVDSLYTNTSLVAILELSMGLCVLWILSLMVVYITNIISERLTCKKVNIDKTLEVEVFNPLLEVNVNLDNLSEDINADKKIPLLIEDINNKEKLIDYEIMDEDKINTLNNYITKEDIVIETRNDVNEDVVVEEITEEENEVLEDIIINNNDIIDDVINQNIIEDDSALGENIVVETINDVNEDVIVEDITEEENEVLEDIIIDNNDIIDDVIIQNIVEDNSVSEENIVVETMSDNNKNITTENNELTFNDILNGCIPVNYYENDIIIDEYTLSDPQKMYEDNYNKVKSENIIVDALLTNNIIEEDEVNNFGDTITMYEETKNNVALVDTSTNDEKEKVLEERLRINTVSLNDLIDDEEIDIYGINNTDIDNINDYTVDDYKKMAEMLNTVRKHANNSDINIDDAVAISLIKNYSIDDCLKFKNILENNLN